MARFHTGNPINSGSPLDLDDNAKNFDLAALSPEDTFQDRLGKSRLTWAGMENQFRLAEDSREQRFADALANVGYVGTGPNGEYQDYAAGIEVTEYNQVIRADGEFWKVSPGTDLPYTTTGDGMPEGGAFVSVGDAVLRQDLANPDKGAAMVARAPISVDSIADLLALPEGQRKEGLRYLVASYHDGWAIEIPYRGPSGGGEFRWNPARTDENDGGIILNGFERIVIDGYIEPEMFGGNTSVELQKSVNSGSRVRWVGKYEAMSPIDVPDTVEIIEAQAEIVVRYDTPVDSGLHPTIKFTNFSGELEGRIKVSNPDGGSLKTTDGIQFANSVGFSAGDFSFEGVRFCLLLTACEDFKIGSVHGRAIRGIQQGTADNGGSLVSMTSCKRGTLGDFFGKMVYKAAVYFSIDGSGQDNEDIKIGNVNVQLAESEFNNPVANAVTLRSGVRCSVGDIVAYGGVSALYITQNADGYRVSDFTAGDVYKLGESVPSSTSNAVRVSSTLSYPVGNVSIESLTSMGSYQTTIYLSNCEDFVIAGLLSDTDGRDRSIQFGGDVRTLSIDRVRSVNQGNSLIVHTGGTIGHMDLGDVILDGYSITGAPISLTTPGAYKSIRIGSIHVMDETPSFSRIMTLGSPGPDVSVSIDEVISVLPEPVILRGTLISAIRRGEFYTPNSPSASPELWPSGSMLISSNPAPGSARGWVSSGAAWLAMGALT